MTSTRLVIYTATFAVLVGNVEDCIKDFTSRVQALGGYLSRRQDGTVTLRVPADKFDQVVQRIPEYGNVVSRQVVAEDVTRKVTELRLRVENAERARARILELLERAQAMQDVLALEKELRRLTEEIELLKSQLRGVEDLVAFSTVTVEFRSNAPEMFSARDRRASPFGWINRVGAEHVLNASWY